MLFVIVKYNPSFTIFMHIYRLIVFPGVHDNSTMTAWRKHIIQSHIFEITILHKFVVTTFPKSTQNNNMPYKYIYLHRAPSFVGNVRNLLLVCHYFD